MQVDSNNVSKIILGGPLKSRISLDATFRGSFIIDRSPPQCKYRSLSKSKLLSKKSQEEISQTIEHHPNPEKKKSIEKSSQLHSLTPKLETKNTQDSYLYQSMMTHQNAYKMKNTLRSTIRSKAKPESFPKSLGRYSPWGKEHD